MIKELREATSAGVLDCREALRECEGDFEAATSYLREKGLSEVAKRSDKTASDGRVEAYIHHGDQVGVLLELNSETDFVARTEEFKALAHNLALHIAFADPDYLTRDDVPEEVLESEKELYRKQALEEGKPEHIVERIVEGRLEKFYEENCLMEQPFVKDDEKVVQDLINEALTKFGENIVLRRFVRYEVGEAVE
jgi:elongation factor Ts